MKTALVRVLPILFLFVFTRFADAGDFQSVVLSPTMNPSVTITVSGDHFLVIRNFTQDGGSTRGEVTATLQPSNLMATVMTASFVNSAEVINNVVIAGPASVSVTCSDTLATSCFITYRKGDD